MFELIGIDPFASAGLEERAGRPAAFGVGRLEEARGWFTRAGAVVMNGAAARALGVAEGASFELEVGGVAHRATLIARLAEPSAGLDAVMLTDIAQAQEWLESTGKLSRIDVRLPTRPGRARRSPASSPPSCHPVSLCDRRAPARARRSR